MKQLDKLDSDFFMPECAQERSSKKREDKANWKPHSQHQQRGGNKHTSGFSNKRSRSRSNGSKHQKQDRSDSYKKRTPQKKGEENEPGLLFEQN